MLTFWLCNIVLKRKYNTNNLAFYLMKCRKALKAKLIRRRSRIIINKYTVIFRIKILLSVIITFSLSACNQISSGGLYPTAVMWYSCVYATDMWQPLDNTSIDSEIGIIKRQTYPMPERDGDINDMQSFKIGDRLFTIKNVETTEAIAVLKGEQFYRLNRLTSSVKLIWDDKMYFFKGYANDDEIKAGILNQQIGNINRTVIDSSISESEGINGDIIISNITSAAGSWANFAKDCSIYSLKGYETNEMIAVIDTTGKIRYAQYYKRYTH